MMYVVGGMEENEIMLYNVVLALRDSLHLLFKYLTLVDCGQLDVVANTLKAIG